MYYKYKFTSSRASVGNYRMQMESLDRNKWANIQYHYKAFYNHVFQKNKMNIYANIQLKVSRESNRLQY